VFTATMCLAYALYWEARSEPVRGQIAVSEVILNRVESSQYPDDICGVVKQQSKGVCQFSYFCDGKSDKPRNHKAYLRSMYLAELMISEGDYITVLGKGVTHYHADYVEPYWCKSPKLEFKGKIGKHLFYSSKG